MQWKFKYAGWLLKLKIPVNVAINNSDVSGRGTPCVGPSLLPDQLQFVLSYRNDKCRSVTPGGTWLPHAVSSRMPSSPIWHYVGMLAQRPHEAANFWDPAVETRGLLHHGRFRVQGGIGLLRPRPPPRMATLNATVTPSPFFPPHVMGCLDTDALPSCITLIMTGACPFQRTVRAGCAGVCYPVEARCGGCLR